MSSDKKFCPSCGEQLPADIQFCSSCGFDFEKRELPSEEPVAETEKQGFDFSQIDVSNFDVKKVTNKQWGIIGAVAAAIILLVVFLFSGNVSIAGTYENEDTITDLYETNTVTISRNGKTVIEGTEDDMNVKLTFYIKEFKPGAEYTPSLQQGLSQMAMYQADYSKDFELEVTIPEYLYMQDPETMLGIEFISSSFGLNLKDVKEGKQLSGKLNAELAEMFDLDFIDILIEEDPRGILLGNSLFLEI